MTLATAAAVAVVLGATTAAALRPPTALRAVWSNELAVRDYQNLLAGKVEARLEDGPGIVLCQPGDPLADAWAKLAPGAADAVLPFGSEIPESWRLGVAPAVMFTGMVVIGISNRPGIVAAVVGAGVTLLALDLPHNSGLLVGALAGVVTAYLAETMMNRHEQNDEPDDEKMHAR